jgi:uncharacterized membrane protein
MLRFCAALVFAVLLFPVGAFAQADLVQDTITLQRARVIAAESLGSALIPGTTVSAERQLLTVEVLDGAFAGRTVTFENDFTQLREGQTFYLRHLSNPLEGVEFWTVSDPDRVPVLIGIAIAFLVLLVLFGGLQGIRGLASLAGSIVLIFAILLPSLYAGTSPILVSIGVSSLIILVGSYITHGFTRTTTAAMLGMVATVVITGLATWAAILLAQLSGFSSETNVYLNFNTQGRIDMIGLLFGGIIIGLLGVLYDGAIGQAVSVEELYVAGESYSPIQVFWRAMRMGREHIGALVNTLAIAYVGSALPLLLLFRQATTDIRFILNSELFATEIIRILMGSIGLILAVPITTLIATVMLKGIKQRSGVHHCYAH